MSARRPRLIVFARVPILGRVKTRLAASIGDEAALDVHRALLATTLGRAVEASPGELELCIDGDDPHGECAALARASGARLRRQSGDSLGERMDEALTRALGEGCLPVLIGCDAPSVQPADLHAAFEALAQADAVFAPAEDGGYALVGCRRPIAEAFRAIDWGSPTVMGDTRSRLVEAGIDWRELRTVWDVDDAEDLRRWQAAGAGWMSRC